MSTAIQFKDALLNNGHSAAKTNLFGSHRLFDQITKQNKIYKIYGRLRDLPQINNCITKQYITNA